MPPLPEDVTVLVLCGGSSRRFGADKLGQSLGGGTVLDTLLGGMPVGWPVVAVGPPRETSRPVAWTTEDPPGGGPLAGIAAGAAVVRSQLVVVVAGDMPFAAPAAADLAAALAAALANRPGLGAVAARDGSGRLNPLLAAYRTSALRAALPIETSNGRAKSLLDALEHDTLLVGDDAALDVDTPDRLAEARHRLQP